LLCLKTRSKSDALFNLQPIGQDDISPLCPVVWIGKKRVKSDTGQKPSLSLLPQLKYTPAPSILNDLTPATAHGPSHITSPAAVSGS
jgi:hypothetical protein